MNIPVLQALAGLSREAYHGALPKVAGEAGPDDESRARFVFRVALELAGCQQISEREQGDRLHAVLSTLEIGPEGLRSLALACVELPRGLKNTVSKFLPVAHRPLLYGRSASRDGRTHRDPPDVQPPALADAPADRDQDEDGSTVFLLAREDTQSYRHNKRLLNQAGFAALRLDDRSKLSDALSGSVDICACVVDRSFLSGLSKPEQASLFRELAVYSTFLWVRVEGGGLLLADPELHDIMRRARCQCSEPTSYQISVQQVGDLGERELAYVRRARDVLRTNRTARFVPGELCENERMVLLAAARQYALESNLEPDVAIESLQTRFIQAGRSEAKIAVVRVNSQRMPIVAKIAPKRFIFQEMERFLTFIRCWDNELAPRVFLHGECGVIFFGLVRGEADSTDPAPHLERRLEDFWVGEVFPHAGLDPSDEENLVAGLENAASLLCSLNSGKCEHAGFDSLSNPDMGYIRRLEERRVRWDFEEAAYIARDLAFERFKSLAEVAVVHGDIHLRNILVRGSRDAHLIDYAGCGPGHPAIDLARLELLLYLRCFKQKQDESRCREFQTALTIELVGSDELLSRFSGLLCSSLNRICMRGCVAARDGAIAASRSHGGNASDYVAAKYLATWQYLLVDGMQGGLARSVICALSPEIVKWA